MIVDDQLIARHTQHALTWSRVQAACVLLFTWQFWRKRFEVGRTPMDRFKIYRQNDTELVVVTEGWNFDSNDLLRIRKSTAFGTPVVFDDDGGSGNPTGNCNVWVKSIINSIVLWVIMIYLNGPCVPVAISTGTVGLVRSSAVSLSALIHTYITSIAGKQLLWSTLIGGTCKCNVRCYARQG